MKQTKPIFTVKPLTSTEHKLLVNMKTSISNESKHTPIIDAKPKLSTDLPDKKCVYVLSQLILDGEYLPYSYSNAIGINVDKKILIKMMFILALNDFNKKLTSVDHDDIGYDKDYLNKLGAHNYNYLIKNDYTKYVLSKIETNKNQIVKYGNSSKFSFEWSQTENEICITIDHADDISAWNQISYKIEQLFM